MVQMQAESLIYIMLLNICLIMLQILLSMGMKRKSLRSSDRLRFCLIPHLLKQNPALKCISHCMVISLKELITMVSVSTRKV